MGPDKIGKLGHPRISGALAQRAKSREQVANNNPIPVAVNAGAPRRSVSECRTARDIRGPRIVEFVPRRVPAGAGQENPVSRPGQRQPEPWNLQAFSGMGQPVELDPW